MKRLYQLIFSFRKSEFEKSVYMLIGYRTSKMVLFHTAFNHRSLKENPSENNERMEFLGDAIISSVVAEYLFKKYPYKGEGFLTEMRSKMVNRQQLNHIAIQMGLKKMTRFNKLDGGLKSSQIFGNTLEALVGAIYLDKQYEFTKKWIIEKMIQPYLFMDELEQIDINIKNKIIFFKQKVFYYKLNLELKTLRWIGTKACKKKHLKSPQWLRNIKDKIYPKWRIDILFSEKKYNDIFFVENGGWHFTFVKKPEDIEKKLKSYLHHREYDIDPVGVDKIRNLINLKSVIYDHRVDQTQYKFGGGQKLEKIDLEFLPRYISSNKEKYLDWLEK